MYATNRFVCLSPLTDSQAPSFPGKVFSQLLHLLRPLSHALLSCEFGKSRITLMSEFRAVCGDEPMEMLVKQCLKPSVPSNQKHLDTYKSVITDTEKFEVRESHLIILNQTMCYFMLLITHTYCRAIFHIF